MTGAFSGLEIVCRDTTGKSRERPLWAMLGGRVNDRIHIYSYLYPLQSHDISGFWFSSEMAAESALDLVARGYRAVAVDPAAPRMIHFARMPSRIDLELYERTCASVREAM